MQNFFYTNHTEAARNTQTLGRKPMKSSENLYIMLETKRTTVVMMMLMKNNIIVDLGFKNPIFPEGNIFLLLFTMVQFNSKAIHLSKSTLIIYSIVTKGD